MARPRKEIDRKQFENLCGLQCALEELKGFGWRAILSSFCGETADSALFIPIAFIGTMPVQDMVMMSATQVCLKVLYEIIILPVTTQVCKRVKAYEQLRL